MLADLPPELIKRIIDHCLDKSHTFGRINNDTIISNQQQLLDLSLTCKTLSEHCLPLLYADALLSHPSGSHNHDAPFSPVFEKAKRLRISHRRTTHDAMYRLVLCATQSNTWPLVSVKRTPNGGEPQSFNNALEEATLWHKVASRLVDRRATRLSNLERVVMGDQGELWWYQTCQEERFELLMSCSNSERFSLAQYLVQLPSVQHYCQSEMFGPFALPCKSLRMATPPRIVTHHMPRNFFEEFEDDPNILPPVVNGAINRYIFPTPATSFILPDQDPKHLTRTDESNLDFLVNMMRRDNQLTWGGLNDRGPDDATDRSDTIIEVYNFIARLAVDSLNEAIHLATRLHEATHPGARLREATRLRARLSEPPRMLSLKRFQMYLDDKRQPKYPRLYLKTLDEAGPCTACDFDFRAAGYDTPQLDVVARWRLRLDH